MITYTSLQAAVTAIGSSVKSVLVSGSETLSANLTIPSTLEVTMAKGAVIALGDYTLTINGVFNAGLSQCFNLSGSGVVSFGSGAVKEVYPEWFGAAGDGTTDDSVAVQAAQDAVATNGGILYFGQRVYLCNFILDSNVWVKGSGVNITILQSVASSDADVIAGRNFSTLTGTSKATPETRGVRYVKISDLTIKGDKATNSSGFGIRLWGCSLQFDNLMVQDCAEDGIWTEFTTHDTPSTPDWQDNMLESFFNNIKVVGNGGNGWTFNGPHDSHLNNFVAAHNGGWGFEGLTGYSSICGSNWNGWSNTTGCYTFTAGAALNQIVASGPGIGLQSLQGGVRVTNLFASGCVGVAVDLTGQQNFIQGVIRASTTHALQLTSVCWNKFDLIMSENASNLNIVSEAGANFYSILISITGTQVRGDLPGGSSAYWIQVAGETVETNVNYPTRDDFTVGGYDIDFPTSNGTIVVA